MGPAQREGWACFLECLCSVFVFVCKYVLGRSLATQPPNLRLYLLRHFGFLTSPHAIPTCSGCHPNSFRLLRLSTSAPQPHPRAHFLHDEASKQFTTKWSVLHELDRVRLTTDRICSKKEAVLDREQGTRNKEQGTRNNEQTLVY